MDDKPEESTANKLELSAAKEGPPNNPAPEIDVVNTLLPPIGKRYTIMHEEEEQQSSGAR
jgi:hypothetical protein